MTWVVGRQERIERQWFANSGPVTSGTASLQIWYVNAGNRIYLQADAVTFTNTLYTFPMVQEGQGFKFDLTVPAASQGKTLVAEASHSAFSSYPPLDEDHYVTAKDIDSLDSDVANLQASGATVRV